MGRRVRIAVIGFGAIARPLIARLAADPAAGEVVAVLVRPARVDEVRRTLGAGIGVVGGIDDLLGARPDLVVECAGHEAVATLAAPVLERGTDVLIVSVGALAEPPLLERVRTAAGAGDAQALIPAGAVAGIDALAAARLAGLERVTYRSRKPPAAWHGTPAAEGIDLDRLDEARLLYTGPAGEAARLYPKNANVAATIALAGLGFDATQVEVIADPAARGNVHELEAAGAFGHLALRIENRPAPDNPKTSFLTGLSVERAIRNRSASLAV